MFPADEYNSEKRESSDALGESDKSSTSKDNNKALALLGENLNVIKKQELGIKDDMKVCLRKWIKSGLEKEAALESSPTIKDFEVNLNASFLNEEIAADINPKAQARDSYYMGYQNLKNIALTSTGAMLSAILND